MKNIIKIFVITLIPFIVGIYLPEKEETFASETFSITNPGHLDGAFTGGFGEQTCHSCHFDYDLNYERGSLSLEGVPDKYKPGKEYEVQINLQSEKLEIGGFQMTARFRDGSQAGQFNWEGNSMIFTPQISDSVKYLQHSRDGTSPTGDKEISWNFIWKAPSEPRDSVIFNIAANAGNNDDSAFGDWIYVKELISIYQK